MKKILFPFLCLLFSVIIFGACDKESISSEKLEGTWRTYTGEMLFDGSVILRGNDAMESFSAFTFSDGYVTISNDGDVERYPYTFSNSIITMMAYSIPIQMRVKKLTSSELILEIPVITLENDLGGGVYTTYKGKEIFRTIEDFWGYAYWYISNNKVVVCEPIDEDDLSIGWVDTYRIYLKK